MVLSIFRVKPCLLQVFDFENNLSCLLGPIHGILLHPECIDLIYKFQLRNIRVFRIEKYFPDNILPIYRIKE